MSLYARIMADHLVTSMRKIMPEHDYQMILNTRLIIQNEKVIIKEQSFSSNFTYSHKDNKFDLSEYEMNVEQNLVDNIIKKLNIYLNM